MEHKRYIYLGGNIDLPEFGFQKGSVYFGDKIEKLKEKYPLLDKLLIPVEELAGVEKNGILLEKLTEELRNGIGGDN